VVPLRFLYLAAPAVIACEAPLALERDMLPAMSVQAALGQCPRERTLDLELPTWDLYVSDAAWQALHTDVQADVSVDALLCVHERAYPIDLELQGASTRKLRKKSFDLKFGKQRPLEEPAFGAPEQRARILLKAMANDQSAIREALAFETWRELGHIAPRVGFANLRINGAYWGLYNLLEPINDDFLERHGFLVGGHLYKAIRTKEGRADFRPGRDLHTCFEDKSDQETDTWPDLHALVGKLQRTPLRPDAFTRDIGSVFPLAPYIDRMIWIAVSQNSDAVAQNFYLYNAPVDGHDAWTMLPWDSNVAFGAHWSDPYAVLPADAFPLVRDGAIFGTRLLQVKELRAQFIERFRALLDTQLATEPLLAQATRLFTHVQHDLAADQERWQREVDPEQAFGVIESFLRARPDVLRAELDVLASEVLK
jgi:spore coat protein H